MTALLVTAYVPIPDHPRTAKEYGDLGEKLSGVPVPKKAFYDRFQDLWMSKFLVRQDFVAKPSAGDNPAKNTTIYHAVNHQKTSWLVQAADANPTADVLVWVDYGIFHLPGVNNQAIYEFMERVTPDAIHIPGCWDKPEVIESAYPCWRFCGSVIAVPRTMVDTFDFHCRRIARQHIQRTQNVEWEVNTWARVEQDRQCKLPIHWYKADHDVSMFTNL